MSDGGFPDEGLHTRKFTGEFYVQALEVPSGDPAGGAAPLTTVTKMWHTHARGEAVPELTDIKVQPGNVDVTTSARHGAGSEGGRYEVYYLLLGGRTLGGRGDKIPISWQDSKTHIK